MTRRGPANMRASYLFPSTSLRSSSAIARRRRWTVQNRTNTLCGWQTVRLSWAWRCGGGGGGAVGVYCQGEKDRGVQVPFLIWRGGREEPAAAFNCSQRSASAGISLTQQPGAFIKASLACFIKRCLRSDALLSGCGVSQRSPFARKSSLFFLFIRFFFLFPLTSAWKGNSHLLYIGAASQQREPCLHEDVVKLKEAFVDAALVGLDVSLVGGWMGSGGKLRGSALVKVCVGEMWHLDSVSVLMVPFELFSPSDEFWMR